MKVAPSAIPLPDLSARAGAPKGRLSFKSALADAERLIERRVSVPCQSGRLECSDDSAGRALPRPQGDLADRTEAERKLHDILKRDQARAFGARRDDELRRTPPERTPIIQVHAWEQRADSPPQSGFTRAPAIRSRRSNIHLAAASGHSHLVAFPGSSLTASQAGAESAAVAERQVVASPIDADRSANPQANARPVGLHRIEWTVPEPASSSSPQRESNSALAPRSAGSIAWTITKADRFKDDGKTPLGFAEPGVIRSLRCNTERRNTAIQHRSGENRPTARAASHIESDRRPALAEPGDRPGGRTAPQTGTSTRGPCAERILRLAFVHARPNRLSAATGILHAAAPNRTIEEAGAPTRTASKAQLPRPQTTKQRTPSLIFSETAGALDVIIGLFSVTPDQRARLQRALDAAASEYGLRITNVTLNGASVERANGPRGG